VGPDDIMPGRGPAKGGRKTKGVYQNNWQKDIVRSPTYCIMSVRAKYRTSGGKGTDSKESAGAEFLNSTKNFRRTGRYVSTTEDGGGNGFGNQEKEQGSDVVARITRSSLIRRKMGTVQRTNFARSATRGEKRKPQPKG